MEHSVKTEKVVLLGDGGTGKSTLIWSLIKGEFLSDYEVTMGAHIYPLTISTTGGDLSFDCWDTNGQERLGTSRDDFYRDARFAVLFFDVQSRLSYKNCPLWYRDLKRVAESVEVVLVGNKVDVEVRQVKPSQVVFHKKVEIPYIEMSAKHQLNVEQPFLIFARSLLKDPSIALI